MPCFGARNIHKSPSLFDVNRGTRGDEKPICQAEYDRKVKVPNMAGLRDQSGIIWVYIVYIYFFGTYDIQVIGDPKKKLNISVSLATMIYSVARFDYATLSCQAIHSIQ